MTLQQLQVFIEKFKQKTDLSPNQVYAAFYNVIQTFLEIIRAALGANVNSDNTSLQLSDRGYYNYIGNEDATWMLPLASDSIRGRFFRIYNKSTDMSGNLTIDGNGSQIFRGGMQYDFIQLAYGENLTMVFDGTEWNCYN